MVTALQFTGALLLFLVGLRLSAFFSGGETGFYRMSYLRLSIDAHAGDPIARRLLWFSNNPSYFVATTLVGNNVANYLTTLAIGLGIACLLTDEPWWAEIVGTLLLSPLIFLWGELLPKNLYYRAPMTLLRRDARWFHVFYRLFYPLSFPLIGITKLFEWLSHSENKAMELVLGRSRLVHVLREGHREGLLTETQSRLVNGIMHAAGQPVQRAMTPVNRVLGLSEEASREEIFEHARRYGMSRVPLHAPDDPSHWRSYLRVIDLKMTTQPMASLRQPMPDIDSRSGRLEALLRLREAGTVFGRVIAGDRVLGLVNERGLMEQLFRPPQFASPTATTD